MLQRRLKPVAAGCFLWGKVPTSHVALEVALETKPNLLLLTEEAPAMGNNYVSRDHMWIMWSLFMLAASVYMYSWMLLRLRWNIGKLSEVPTMSGSFMLGASRVIFCCNCNCLVFFRWMITATTCEKLSATSRMLDPELRLRHWNRTFRSTFMIHHLWVQHPPVSFLLPDAGDFCACRRW